MQPDTKTITSMTLIPFVGIIDGECAAAIKIREFFARQVGSNKIYADRRFLVTFVPAASAADIWVSYYEEPVPDDVAPLLVLPHVDRQYPAVGPRQYRPCR